MYPGYKRRDVLDEYMVVYIAMLNEGYRQENENYYMLGTLNLLPWMDKQESQAFMKKLEWAARRADDILETNDDASSTEEIRKFLG